VTTATGKMQQVQYKMAKLKK